MEELYQYDLSLINPKKNSQINYRLIAFTLGILVWVEAGLFACCAGISLAYCENDYHSFIRAILINGVLGTVLIIAGKRDHHMNRRDGYCIVSLSWLLFTALGMLPFYLSGHIPSITDAFFETMSGFTTTGATILNDIESLPHGLLFWRSLTQWIGGLGIVLFTIALLPLFSGSSQQLFLSEATGVTHNKIHPKITVMARWLWIIYIGLTLVETLLLVLGDMNLFDAICHSFSTTATGGFSTKQASVAHWNSAYIEYVIAIFMILSGVNFSLYYLAALRGNFKHLYRDEELHWFLKSVGILTLIITAALFLNNYYDLETSFRKALFQVATTHTSCGFATDDYNQWPPFTWMLLIFAMISGGCTGSTSGGVKNLRFLIIARNIKNQFKQMLHPRAVLSVRINEISVPVQTTATVYTFFVTYLICIFLGWALLMFCGVGLTESMSTVISAIGNVGPGLGAFGPEFSWAALPDAAKWILSALMFIGRLEIFGILLLFYRGYWERD